MTVKNSMQLKARVKKIAQEKRITSQLVLQNYMQERFWRGFQNQSIKEISFESACDSIQEVLNLLKK